MAKKSKKDTRIEMLKNEAMKSVESALREDGIEFSELSDLRKYRIEQYLYILAEIWDDIPQHRRSPLATLTKACFDKDYEQLMGYSNKIVVLKDIPYASTRKATLIFE